MKKWFAVLLAVLLLCACDTPPILTEQPIQEQEPSVPVDAQTVLFLVDRSMDDVFYQSALRFAGELESLTSGGLQIEVQRSAAAGSRLLAGQAQFAFVDSKTDQNLSQCFEAVATPFLYANYEVFSMAVNSDQMKDMMTEGMDGAAVPLGAFYQPSRHLLTTWQPSDYLYFNQARISVDPSSGSGKGFSRLGAGIADEPDVQERFALIIDGWVEGGEFTLEEITTLDWSSSIDSEIDFYLTLTYHTTDPVWLLAAEDFLSSLSAADRAAVTEAVAYLYAEIDGQYIRREEGLVEQLRAQGMLINPADFSMARKEVFEQGEDQLEEEDSNPYTQYVLSLISELE